MTYVILDVGLASGPQDDPTGLVVAVLAAEMEGRESTAIPEIKVGAVLAQRLHRPAEPLPRRLVQGRVPVLQKDEIHQQ